MQKVKVTIRRDRETKRPILFFVNENPRGWWIDCYDRIGQHSQASREYLLKCEYIRPIALDPEALALIREWRHLGEVCEVQTMARLTYPRTSYIGS